MVTAGLTALIADRIHDEHRTLARRWFERLLDLLPVDARGIFPSDTLLDHVPALILELSEYLREPEEAAIIANTGVLAKARELGALRYRQRASLHQVVREYHLLGGVLVAFVLEEIERQTVQPTAAEAIRIIARLHQAVNVLSQTTVETFVRLYTEQIDSQRDRLEQFTRMAAHEWRQPLGALQFGITLLRQPNLPLEHAAKTLDAVSRNVSHLVEMTRKLESVARMHDESDTALVQTVCAASVADEAARQLREMADARDVSIAIAEDLPTLTIDVGRLELIFVNLLSNAIKYSDPAKPARRVEVTAGKAAGGACVISIADNGMGIPESALPTIFARFTRAQPQRDDVAAIDGMGLGLSIVADCVHAVGGRVDVHSRVGEGTTFALTLPFAPDGMLRSEKSAS